jgi:bacillithiol biosynthesis cysteine-adding enzyme BshC
VQPTTAPSSDSALRLAVDVRTLPWMRRLAVDYAFDYDTLAPFFAGNPAEPAAWADVVARVQAHARPRDGIVAMLQAQQARRDSPPEARAAAAALADPAGVAIVTGQQAGLFGGPLFTLLKAVTAIRLARRLSRDRGIPVVPVFWIDAEDHDWDEIASASVLAADQTLRTISAEAPDGAGERAIASLACAASIDANLDDLAAALPPTEFTADLVATLRTAYRPGRGVADAFGRLLDRVLGPHGLVVYDASDPAAKPFAAPIFRHELEHVGETTRLAAAAGAELVARGYHMQVTPHEGAAALFDLADGRRAIRAGAGRFLIGDEAVAVDREALLARLAARPETFSPNVLLRPLVQDAIFPTVCYVAGPNELAYLGQLKGVYAAFGIPMPLMQPRATATVVDSAGVRFLTRYKVPLASLRARDEHALNELLRAQLPPSVERTMQEAEQEIAARMEAVIRAVPAIDPTLEGAARNTLGRLQHDLKTLGGKLLQAAKRRDETLRRQFQHLRAQAFPDGEPQERTVAFVSFLNRYGPVFVERLAAELPIDAGTHWVVTI